MGSEAQEKSDGFRQVTHCLCRSGWRVGPRGEHFKWVFNEILHGIGGYDFWTNSITWFTHLHIIWFLFPLCCRTLGQSFQEQRNLLLNTAPKRRSWRFFVHLGEMKPGSLDGHRHQAGLELREYYAAACGHCQVRWGMLRYVEGVLSRKAAFYLAYLAVSCYLYSLFCLAKQGFYTSTYRLCIHSRSPVYRHWTVAIYFFPTTCRGLEAIIGQGRSFQHHSFCQTCCHPWPFVSVQ